MSMGKRLHLSKSQLTGTPAALNKTAQHSAGPHAPPYPGLFSPAREKPKLISASRGGSPSLSFQCLISARQPSSSSHTLPLTFSWFPHLRISGFPQLCPFPKHAHRSPTSALQSLSLPFSAPMSSSVVSAFRGPCPLPFKLFQRPVPFLLKTFLGWQ